MSTSPISSAVAQGAKYARAYAQAVNQNGNVNQKKLNQADGGSVANGRSGIVTGYAAEFMVGDRIPPGQMDAAAAQFAATPDGPAKTFALVASRYKNAGGNYNNGKLKDNLIKAGAGDLANQPGVGKKDVQTLHAVYEAIKAGKIQLSDIFNPAVNGGKGAVKDPGKYQKAIDAVQQGDISSSIQGGGKAKDGGNAGNARNAGASVADTAPVASAADATNPMLQIVNLLQLLQQMLQQVMQQSGTGSPFTGALTNTANAATAGAAGSATAAVVPQSKPVASTAAGGGY